ncbi:MAG: hypothetical protein K8I00_05760 [Candidatus Omnitrophica bacterium]|nr:hypothetical protein [Candidatus Omnitrophota bacterium]
MGKLAEKIRKSVSGGAFTDTTLNYVLRGSADGRYSAVKRAIKNGDFQHIRRGLYVLGEQYQSRPLNLFEVAQAVYGPSYISFESALSYHGWIPEAVYTVTSASMKRSREFVTPLGIFSYTHIPSHKFYVGVDRIESGDGVFLLASPWRALVDFLYAHKKEWKSLQAAADDLRLDLDSFKDVDFKMLEELSQTFRNVRVKNFIRRVKKEFLR